MTETGLVWATSSKTASGRAEQLTLGWCQSPCEARWSPPDRAAAPPRSGPRQLPASGSGTHLCPYSSLHCDPPTLPLGEHGGLRKTVFSQLVPRFSLITQSWELGLSGFCFNSNIIEAMTVGGRIFHTSDYEESSKYNVWRAFTGR